MAKFRDLIDPKTMQSLVGGSPKIQAPSGIEYDTKAFKRADPIASVTGGIRGLEESRALSQSTGELILKGVGNIVENVVFETLKAPGNIYGAAGSAMGSTTAMDNLWLESFNALQESTLGKITEVYVPPSVQEKGLWGQIFNPYFFASEGADAVGTLLSFMIPGAWIKTLGVGGAAARSIAKAGKLGDLAVDGSKFVQLTGDTNQLGKFLVKTLGSTGRGMDFGKLAKNIDSGLAVTVNTVLESSAEAMDTYETMIQEGKTPEEASIIANKVMGLNMALLTVSNTLLEKYVFNGFNRLPSVGKQLSTALKGGTPAFKPIQQGLVKFAAGTIAEGFIEEGLQTTFQQAEGDFARSLQRYAENFESLFGDDPDIEFGKSVFLGSLLGGAVGGISGIADVRDQKALLMGREATTIADTPMGKLKTMLGYTAKEKQEGLIDVMTRNFSNLKLGKDQLKNLSVEGKLDATKLQDETYKFAIGNYFDDLIEKYEGDVTRATDDLNVLFTQDIKLSPEESKQIINTLIPESLTSGLKSISNASSLELVRLNRDIAYFSRFASNPAGFEMLDAHIEDVADSLEERYELSTGVKLKPDAKKKLVEDMRGRSKKFENIYQAARTYNVNTRYGIEVAPEEKLDFEKFMLQSNMRAVDSMLYLSNLEEISEKLSQETEAATKKIEQAKNIYNNKVKGAAGEELTKEQKDDLLKERDAQIADIESGVVNYEAKMTDLALLNATTTELKTRLLDNATATRLKERWEADRQARQLVKAGSKIRFDGIELPEGDRVAVYNIIANVLTSKGYDVIRDPETGLPIVLEPFYVQNKKGNIYEIVQEPDGFVITNRTTGLRFKNKPSDWLQLFKIKQFSNLTVLTKAEYKIAKQKIDDDLAKIEQDTMVEAMLTAFGSRSEELKRTLGEAQRNLDSTKKILETAKQKLEEVLAKFTKKKTVRKAFQKEADKLKELKNQLEITIRTNTALVTNLEAEVNMLTAQVNALQNTQLYFLQNRDKLVELAKPKEGFTQMYDRAFFEAAAQAAKLAPTELQGIIDIFEQGLIDEILLKLNEQIGNITNDVEEFNQLKIDLENTKTLIDLLLNEIEASGVTKKDVPAEILDKWAGLAEALASGDINDVFKYLYNVAAGTEYESVLDSFVKDVAPYLPLDVTSPIFFSQYAEQRLKEYAQPRYNNLDKLKQRVAIVEQQREALQNLYNRVYKKLRKLSGGQVRPPWDPLSDEEGFPKVDLDETTNKTLALATSSGRNLEQDSNGKDQLLDAEEGYKLPVVNPSEFQKTFFRWLDTLQGDEFKVLPYVPAFNDTDFNDITDADTAIQLRDAISGTPQDRREGAVYIVILDRDNKVMIHEDLPLINSLMTPEVKFGDTVKVANRALLSNFINHLLDSSQKTIDLKSKDITSTDPINKDKLAALKAKMVEKGYDISLEGLETKQEVYGALLPLAIVYNKLKYEAFIKGVRDKAVEQKALGVDARDVLKVVRVSRGIAVKAVDDAGNTMAFPTLESLGLTLNKAGNPAEGKFGVVKANFKGIGKSSFSDEELSGLQPGRVYIELNDGSMIPLQTQTLTDSEIEVALYLISKLGGYVSKVSKLEDIYEDGLEGSIRIGGKDVDLKDVPLLNMKSGSVSLMSMIMNWGTDFKRPPKKYDIYVTKGVLHFGNQTMTTLSIMEAYQKGDYAALAPLIDFLRTKRFNVNYNLLQNRSGTHYKLEVITNKDGSKKLKSINVGHSYVKAVLDRSFVQSPSREVLDKYGLPRFAQRHLEFDDSGAVVNTELFKQEIKVKQPYQPKPSAPAPTPAPTASVDKLAAIQEFINLMNQSKSFSEFQNKLNNKLSNSKFIPFMQEANVIEEMLDEAGASVDWEGAKAKINKGLAKTGVQTQVEEETKPAPTAEKKGSIFETLTQTFAPETAAAPETTTTVTPEETENVEQQAAPTDFYPEPPLPLEPDAPVTQPAPAKNTNEGQGAIAALRSKGVSIDLTEEQDEEPNSVTIDNIDTLTTEQKEEVLESNNLNISGVDPDEEVTTTTVEQAVQQTNDTVIANAVADSIDDELKKEIAKENNVKEEEVQALVEQEVRTALENNGKVRKTLGEKLRKLVKDILKFLTLSGLALTLYYNTGQIRAPRGTLRAVPNTVNIVEASFLPSTFSRVKFEGCQQFINNQIASTVGGNRYNEIGLFGHAWTASGNMVRSGGGTFVYNAFKNYVKKEGLTKADITASVKNQINATKSEIDTNSFREGDVVSLFYEGSMFTEQAYKEGIDVYTSHAGIIKKSGDGKLVLEHNIHGRVHQDNIEDVLQGKVKSIWGQMLISAIARPNYNKVGVFLQKDVKGYEVDQTTPHGQQFLDNLFNVKPQLLKLYPTVTSATYDNIAKLAYGVFGRESSFGEYGRVRGKLGYLTDIVQLDLQSFGIDKNPSVGVTQIRITSISPEAREALNIKKSSDLLNIEKAAQGTMAVLLNMYVTEIPTSMKPDYAKLLPLGYNNRKDFRKALKGDTSMYNNPYITKVNAIADLVKFKTSKKADLRRDAESILEAAVSRGIINKTNCK